MPVENEQPVLKPEAMESIDTPASATLTIEPVIPPDKTLISTSGQPQLHYWRWPPSFRYALTLEGALYSFILVLAVFTRFYDLDYRALHHDEGVHAYYSWRLFNGDGYEQEPWKHGPFMFFMQAAAFWIFGDSNQTVRLSTAFFGVVVCLMPLALRKELGRWGALTAALLLTISPMFMYFSRFLREDIFVAFATLGLFIGLVRLVDRPRQLWWNITMLALALLFCTKEVSFFYLVLFGGFLLAWLCWQIAPRLILILGGCALLAMLVFFFTVSLYPPPVIPFETTSGPAISKYIGDLAAHPVFWLVIILGVLGLGVAWAAFHEVAANRRRFVIERGWAGEEIKVTSALFSPYRQPGTVAYAVGWLGRHKPALFTGLGLGLAFYIVFYTGFFTDIPQGSVGVFSGLWYWMAQQGVARGNQPWYYYFFMLPLYEPLALFLGTLASGLILKRAFKHGFRRQRRTVLVPVQELEPGRSRRAPAPEADDELENSLDSLASVPEPASLISRNRAQALVEMEVLVRPAGNDLWPGRRRREPHPYFVPLLMVAWAFGALAIYTWASEKMPWLTVQLALPFIILAAYLMDGVWSGLEEFFTSGEHRQLVIGNYRARFFFWLHLGGMVAIGFLFYLAMLYLSASELKISASGGGRFEWLVIWIPPVLALLFFTAIFSFIGLRIALKTTLAAVFGLMTFFLLHTAFTYAFDHGDVPLEMGIYTQTAPDAYRVVRELDTVTTILPDLKRTPVLYDDELRTPLDFYLRNYSQKLRVSDFNTVTAENGTRALSDYKFILMSDTKLNASNEGQKKILSDNFVSYHYTFHLWFEESQYRDFDKAAAIQLQFLQGKGSLATIKDANNNIVLNKGEIMTTERLQQLTGQPGVLDKIYNSQGANSALLHLRQAGQSLAQLSSPAEFARLWRYVMFREQLYPSGRREFTLYVKKDIIGLWRQYSDLLEFPISRPQ